MTLRTITTRGYEATAKKIGRGPKITECTRIAALEVVFIFKIASNSHLVLIL